MISRNGVRVDTQQLRDIQDLISKLADVNKQLEQPVHAVPLTQVMEAETAGFRGQLRSTADPAAERSGYRYTRAIARSSRADAAGASAADLSCPNVRR